MAMIGVAGCYRNAVTNAELAQFAGIEIERHARWRT